MTNLMSVFEIIGSIAFAISGSMLAIKKEMDLFGILILGIVTSVGGGAIRDIVIGNTPPAMFQNPKCTVISSITAIVVFLIWKLYNRNTIAEKIARRTDNIPQSVVLVRYIGTGSIYDSWYGSYHQFPAYGSVSAHRICRSDHRRWWRYSA